MKTWTRKQPIWAITTFIAISITGLWIAGDVIDAPFTHAVDFMSFSGPKPHYCTRREVSLGWWEDTGRFSDVEEIPAAFGYQTWKHNYCGAVGATWKEGVTSGKPIAEENARKIAVASPVFVKANNCSYRDTELRDKLIMLLRMPAGAYLIGDSLGLQNMRAHENIWVGRGGVKVTMQGNWEWYPLSRHLVLDRAHPDTALLLQEAGVSAERLDYPLLSWYRTWHLLYKDHLFKAFAGVPEFDFHDQNTKTGVLDWYGEVTAKIKQAVSRVKFSEGVLPEPTAMLFHGGAHFTASQLGLKLTDDQLVEGYSRTVDIIEEMMRSMPIPLSLYWQTTVPGHIDCGAATTFDNGRTNSSSPLEIDRKLYNYHIFFRMVSYLRFKFADDAPRRHQFFESSDSSTFRNPPMRLLDTYDMTIKRPDAHRGPPDDCLHYCSAGVPDEWVKYWWHMMLEEKVNAG